MSSDGLTFKVYNATNATLTGTLSSVIDGEFVDEFNQAGSGFVTVPLSSADAALLVKDAVVRVDYQGSTRYAFFIETVERDLANNNGQKTLTASGRGLLAWLEDAVIYPQGGLSDFNTADRPFNYASGPGGWRNSGNYQDAVGVAWKDDTTARKGLPVKWKDRNAKWIWRTDPENETQAGTENWFYRDFTLTEPKRIRFFATADNHMTVWLNGNKVMASSDFDKEAPSFTQMARFTTRLGAGTHTLAAKVRNGAPWRRFDLQVSADDDTVSAPNHGLTNGTELTVIEKDGATGLTVGSHYFVRQRTDSTFKLATTNSDATIVNITAKGDVGLRLRGDRTAGFLLTGIELDGDGKETSVVVRTGEQWQVSSTRPFWRPAVILKELIDEAATRGVYRMNLLSFSFTSASPTSGSWSTETTVTLKVGADLLTVMSDMVDLGADFWLNPVTLQLDAWESRGTDRSSTVALALNTNLASFSSEIERPLKTVALVRTSDGWVRASSASLREANGWRETYLEYGNAESEDNARTRALKVLRRTGKTQVVASGVEVVPVSGSLPYVNFSVGDVVSLPNPTGSGSAAKGRILSIGMRINGKTVTFQPEIEVLTTT